MPNKCDLLLLCELGLGNIQNFGTSCWLRWHCLAVCRQRVVHNNKTLRGSARAALGGERMPLSFCVL